MNFVRSKRFVGRHPVQASFAVVALFAVVLWLLWCLFCDVRLRSAMRELESGGIPCRAEAFEARQKPEWEAFTAELCRIGGMFSKETVRGKRYLRYDFEQPEQVAELYRQQPELLREADRLLDAYPDSGLFRRYVPGKLHETALVGLFEARGLSRLNHGRFLYELKNGNPAGAARLFERGGAIRRCLVKDPFLISALVAIACEDIRLHVLFECAESGGIGRFDDAALRHWCSALPSAEADIRRGMAAAFEGEVANVFSIVEVPERVLADRRRVAPVFAKYLAPAYVPFLKLGVAGAAETLAAALPLASRDMLPGNRLLLRERITVGGPGGASPLIRLIDAGYPAPFGNALDAASRGYGRNRILRTGLAVELFRRKHGRLPETPAELVPEFLPEVPVNPFTGKPPVIETAPPGGAEGRGIVSGYRVSFPGSPELPVWNCPMKQTGER
ncbi:MAG: hypothetical protein HPZ91_19980 [Lentisphaeria bacterium]|nr:hypothetical protein [Lentisphaeria bacterium]